ncbi:MAG: DEAD/DEAH box helicase, partial [bacterium]|nr:DEAD/DEAH box helicase [bacterium]
MKFNELSLQPEILEALDDMGYEEMTPIQEAAIPAILEGKDVVGTAETGSGKTGACGVPLVQMVDPSLHEVQALILVPTRELAQQYVAELADIARHTGVRPFAMFGGFDMGIQRAKLKDRVHILVATPGRLIDFMWNHSLPLNHIRTLVLDEADEMLKMGFVENVDFIFSCVLHECQTLLFSATMPKEVRRLADSYLKDPVRIELNKDQVAPQSLEHHFQYISA